MSMAWHVAALSRQEKLPELKRLLSTGTAKQTRAEQLSVMQQLSARFGIPLQKTNLIHRG